MKTTYTNEAYRTFEAVTAADMDGKEDLLVMVTSVGKVQLASAGNAIGTMFKKLNYGAAAINVRMFGKGGTVRVMQKAAIACGAVVCQDPANPTKVITGTTGKVLGIKLWPGTTGADGDIIEILDLPYFIGGTVGSYVATAAAAITGGTSAAITALTSSATTTQAEFNALRDKVALIATDVKNLRDELLAANVLTA